MRLTGFHRLTLFPGYPKAIMTRGFVLVLLIATISFSAVFGKPCRKFVWDSATQVWSRFSRAQAPGRVYYVAPNGHDENPGTEAQPFRTINRGTAVLRPGDKLYIRAGTYHQGFSVSGSGTANRPIIISAYPGEDPVVDAQDTLPGAEYHYLITLKGNHIILDGLEIKNVYGGAIIVAGSYNTVRNMKIHHCLGEGILVGGTGYCTEGITNVHNTIENNEVWMTSLVHEGVDSGGRWEAGINVGRCPQNTLVRGNTVHETWGMGIQVYETYSPTVEDNVVWNNQMTQVYVNNAPYAVVQRNLLYNSPDTTFVYGDEKYPGVGISFCDEKAEPTSRHVKIVNNLVFGGNRGFYFFNQQPASGLKDFLIAHNTFAASHIAGIQLDDGDHESTRVWNNLFVGGKHSAIVPDVPGLAFSHNLWTEEPPPPALSSDDVIGSPHLAKSGMIEGGMLDSEWFNLSLDSPAIDAGISLNEVPSDFHGTARPRGSGPDIGAYESPFSREEEANLWLFDIIGDSGCSLQPPGRFFQTLQDIQVKWGLQRFIESLGRFGVMKSKVFYKSIAIVLGGITILLVLFDGRIWDRIRVRLAWPLPVSNDPVVVAGDYTDLVFLHHSVGRGLINEGDVRELLNQKGYSFWDHDYNFIGLVAPDGTRTRTSYGIPGGQGGGDTDPEGLAVLFAQPVHRPPDNAFSRLMQHEVLIFKSCFTSNSIASQRELKQQKNAYLDMRDVIATHPDKVFIFLTAPPLHPLATTQDEAARARALANWLTSDAFSASHPNLFVFDLFDLLADPATNMLKSDYQCDPNEKDSHPNPSAYETIGPLFVDFVDQSVRSYRSGH
jgi:parallel beta-helix repeat protein